MTPIAAVGSLTAVVFVEFDLVLLFFVVLFASCLLGFWDLLGQALPLA
jgi:hypothetical protein